jgi:hypothetical protein
VFSCPSAEGGEDESQIEEVKQEASVNWGHMDIAPKSVNKNEHDDNEVYDK